MVRKVYIEILARVLLLVITMPLLVRVLEGLLELFESIGGFSVIGRFSPDIVVSIVFIVFRLFSLLLLALSIVYMDSLFYALSLLPLAVVGFDFNAVSIPYIVLTVLIINFLSVVLQGYRDGQFSSFRVRGLTSLAISFSSLAITVIALSYALSLMLWSYIDALRGVSVSSSTLKPLVSFFSENPLGNMLIVVVVLSAFYYFAINLSETLILYLKPSRGVAIKALTLDPNIPIKPPLSSLRNALITLAVSPAVYALLVLALERVGLIAGMEGGSQLAITLARWALAVLTLIVTWVLLTRTLTRFDEREPGLGGVIAGLILTVFVYTLLLITGLWDPRMEGLSLARADSYLAATITDYYRVLFSIVEIIPVLVGLAP